MPNWCDNQVTITGSKSVIDKIEKIVKEEKGAGGLLNFFHPMPEELRDTTADGSENKKLKAKYGYSDWYSWACDNWSTKWDVNEFYGVDRQDGMISFAFSSAWSPPIGAYEYFLAKNEDCTLKAHYYEGGCDFMGVWDNGDDRCYTVSDTAPDGSKDKFWDTEDGEMLDEMFGITESMADWEAEQEAEKEDVTEYVKGNKVNIGEEA